MLQIPDMFELQQLKFNHNYVNNKLAFSLLYLSNPTATITMRDVKI